SPVVVGAGDPALIRRAADDACGRLRGPDGARAPMPPPPELGGRSVDVPRPEKQAYLGLAFRAPAVADPDAAATDLFTYILGDSPSSRLNVVVRDRLALVSAVEAGYVTRQAGGAGAATARLEPE